jgi:hypothetical protein
VNGELHEKKNNEIYMYSILHEDVGEGFMKSLDFPNRSKWLITKVPIRFGSGGILRRFFLIYFYLTFVTKLLFFCLLFIISFCPVDAKTFKTKFKGSEEAATNMLLSGAHTGTDGGDGECIPE